VQFCAVVLSQLVAKPLYDTAIRRNSYFSKCVKTYIGNDQAHEVRHSGIVVLLSLAQVGSSLLQTVMWTMNVYNHRVSDFVTVALAVGSAIDIIKWFLHRLQGSFLLHSFFEMDALIDVLTIVPAIIFLSRETCECDHAWLSLHYLRIYHLLFNFLKIRETGQLEHINDFMQTILLSILRLGCLVMISAGTIFTLEVLGDPSFMVDNFVRTAGGDNISFAQMVYWIIISITTVGYGDFAPRNVISRAATSGFVVVGVGYIFWIQLQFQNAWSMAREGSGRYRKATKDSEHIVVILCFRGSSKPEQMASLVRGFLDEVLHDGGHNNWPFVVFFAPTFWSPTASGSPGKTFQEFLRECGFGTEMSGRVSYLVGDVTDKASLGRAGVGYSSMTFLIPQTNTSVPDQDDELNIYTASAIRNFFPDVRLRLMLLRPRSKELALQAGIELSRCFSLRELKAHMLAQNIRCRGFLPMISGMMMSADAQDLEKALRQAAPVAAKSPDPAPFIMTSAPLSIFRRRTSTRGSARTTELSRSSTQDVHRNSTMLQQQEWVEQYMEGLSRSVFGFELSEDFTGYKFGMAVSRIFKETGAVVVGIFKAGRVSICPQDKIPLAPHTICFAICRSREDLVAVARSDVDESHWREKVFRARHMQVKRMQTEGPHFAAVELLGKYVRTSMVQKVPEPSVPNSAEDAFPNGMLPPVTKKRTSSKEKMNGVMRSTSSYAEGDSDSEDGQDLSALRMRRNGSMPHNRRVSEVLHGKPMEMGHASQVVEAHREEWDRVRRLRASLKSSEHFVLLIVCSGEVWQQVRTFVSALRARYISIVRPIVILAPTDMPAGLLEDCGSKILNVKGSCTKMQDLMDAGLMDASAIAVMTGEVHESDDMLYKDSKVSLCAQIIECWCGISAREIFTMYELQDGSSLRHFPRLWSKRSLALEDLVETRTLMEEPASDEDDDPSSPVDQYGVIRPTPSQAQSWYGRQSASNASFPQGRHSASSLEAAVEPEVMHASIEEKFHTTFDARFAAGQIFSPEIWGSMLGKMYYMPAVLEIMEALTMPHCRGQDSFPYQFRVPPSYVEEELSSLFNDLAMDEVKWSLGVDPGESTEPRNNLEPAGSVGSFDGPDFTQKQLTDSGVGGKRRKEPAVLLAVYRQRADVFKPSDENDEDAAHVPAKGTGGFNYNMLAPSPSLRLRAEDWITAYGSRHFGKRLHALGLLRGTDANSTSANGSHSGGRATPLMQTSEAAPDWSAKRGVTPTEAEEEEGISMTAL